jgi:hypothetical protein
MKNEYLGGNREKKAAQGKFCLGILGAKKR